KDVTAVRVLIDGDLVAEKLDGRPVAVDPGEHSFKYETAGAAPVTETVLIRQGETNRLVSVAFARAPAGSTAPPNHEERRRSAIPTTSWILGGVGVALGGLGAALWISGTSDHSSLESGCAPTRSCSQADVDSAQTKLLAGDVAFGVGLVSLGAAVVLALVAKDPSPTVRAMLTHDGIRASF
ncbi:MAG TPA: hypothetical protein VM925_03320, partial [Labilithrix sp.]|nr:hypothetical protein [Labilithrix sp.]